MGCLKCKTDQIRFQGAEMDGKRVKEEGLEECEKDVWRGQTKTAGKKLLYIRREALRQLFGDTCIDSYQALWKVGALVERASRRTDIIARTSDLQHLRESLKLRGGGGVNTPPFFARTADSQPGLRDDDVVKFHTYCTVRLHAPTNTYQSFQHSAV